MRTFLYYALLLLVFIAVSCSKQTKTEPLAGYPALSTVTEQTKDGKSLIGVVNPQSDHIVIPPAEYKSVKADNYTIVCTKNDNMLEVFKTNGETIGCFEMFTPWSANGNYYLGVRYINKTYYFPEKDLIVSTQNVHNEYNCMLLENTEGWAVYDYDGNFLWQAPQNIGIIRNSKVPTQIWLAIESNDKRPSCALYAADGSGYNVIPAAKWAKLKKTLKKVKEITPTAYAAATDEFDKF